MSLRNVYTSAIVVLAVIAATPLMAQTKTYDIGTEAYTPESSGGPEAIAQSWTFEAAEGFAPGNISGQSGWAVFSGDVSQVISTANPNAGTQHYRNQKEAAKPAGSFVGAFSPNTGPSAIAPQSLSVDVNISANDGADYDVVPQAPSQGFLTARVKFSFTGDILILDDLGGGLTFVDTGDDWVPGVYKNLQIDMDPGANTLSYLYDGALIYTGVAGVFAGTAMEQVVLLADNFHINDVGDFDNLTVTPEPSGIAAMLLGALALLRFRRFH